jgi:hypothetical protein
MNLLFETTDGNKEIVSRFKENGKDNELQVIGLDEIGGQITLMRSADGVEFVVATTDGEEAFIITADNVYDIKASSSFGSGYLKAVYDGGGDQQDIRLIWR